MARPWGVWHCISALAFALSGAGCAIHPLPDDVSRETTFSIVQNIRCEAKAQVKIAVTEGWSWGGSLFAPECIDLLKDTAADLGQPYREMLSQAGHDAYAVADLTPAVMIFTPCRAGISHNTNESIELARTLPGANLLLNAALRRANR